MFVLPQQCRCKYELEYNLMITCNASMMIEIKFFFRFRKWRLYSSRIVSFNFYYSICALRLYLPRLIDNIFILLLYNFRNTSTSR